MLKMRNISLLLIVAVLLCCVTSVSWANTPRVDNLTCEYLDNPLGIDETKPRLSWMLESTKRGQEQTAYRILVASSPGKLEKNVGNLWDTGQVQSDQSIHVVYGGKPLESRMQSFWKVKIWNNKGVESSWSPTAQWSMGLLKKEDWKGRWIGLDPPVDKKASEDKKLPVNKKISRSLNRARWIWYPEGNPAARAPVGVCYFRRLLNIPIGRKIKKASFILAVDNQFDLWINNKKAGSGSNFAKPSTVNVKKYLKPGENVIAVEARNHGSDPNPAGFIGSLRIEFTDGKKLILNTDKQWRSAKALSDKWKTHTFDDSKWARAKVLGKYGMKPWGKATAVDRRLSARYLRKEFKTSKKIRQATAYICGLGYYEFFINGIRVGDHVLDPILRDYSKQLPYVTYDVTEMLGKGNHVLGVMLGNGRFWAPRLSQPTKTGTFDSPRLLMQLEVVYSDNSTEYIVSDKSWLITDKGPIRANNDYDGEEYDARMEIKNWNTSRCDVSTWQPVEMVSAPKGRLTSAALMEPMRVTGKIKPVKLTEPQPGVWVFDMGQNIVGRCRLQVKGPAGTTVKMHFAENIYPSGMLDFRNLRGAKCTDTYILKGGAKENYTPSFTYHGFRYVEVSGFPGRPTLDTLYGEIINTDMPFSGDFQCSDPTITQILKNARWGIRGNYLSIPTDCPQRDERQGWQGDRAAEQRGESYLFGNILLYEKWMGDIRDSQLDDGRLSDVCPNYWPRYRDNVTWPACFVIVPGSIYRHYGDMRAIERNYPHMERWVNRLRGFVKNGIISKDNYGDWCCPPEDKYLIHSKQSWRKTPKNILATSYYYYVLTLMADYAELQGKANDVQKYRAEAEQIKQAFNKELYHAEGYYGNGSQTSQILPLRFGMIPADRRKKIFDYLINHIETKTGGAIGTGLIGGQWLMRTLSDNGRIDIAYRFATRREYPSWGYMIENNATTIWELWNGNTAAPGMNSGNHVMLLGDLIIWMFEYLGGIQSDPAQPGFKHIIMNPKIAGDLTFVRADHNSPYGTIKSDWKLDGKIFKWNITVPPNTTATVYVPAGAVSDVSEGGRPVAKADGVVFLRMEKDRAVFSVGSGSYEFVSKYY